MTRTSIDPRTTGHYSLWLLTLAPSIWAAHLLACYITAAIWCAKVVEPGGTLGVVGTTITWYTVAALAGIAWIGWEGFRRHRHPSTSLGASPSTSLRASSTEATTHDLDSADDRHRFVGFATLLLAGLSAVGVCYAALAAAYFDTCG